MSENRDRALVDSYSYLWDGTAVGWVLVANDDRQSIFNETTRMLLAIDDDSVHEEIVREMVRRNVKVLDSIPPGEFDANSLVIE